MQNYKLSVKLHLALHTVCQIIQLNGKIFAFHLEKLHRAEKIYTGAACGACDKYQVWAQYKTAKLHQKHPHRD